MEKRKNHFQISQDEFENFLSNSEYTYNQINLKAYPKKIVYKIEIDSQKSIFVYSGLLKETGLTDIGKDHISVVLILTFCKKTIPLALGRHVKIDKNWRKNLKNAIKMFQSAKINPRFPGLGLRAGTTGNLNIIRFKTFKRWPDGGVNPIFEAKLMVYGEECLVDFRPTKANQKYILNIEKEKQIKNIKGLNLSFIIFKNKRNKEGISFTGKAGQNDENNQFKKWIPSKEKILKILKRGENQIYEFKREETKIDHLVKTICAFANTKRGGLIFYGVDDSGKVIGTAEKKQKLDECLQNSILNTIDPPLIIDIAEKPIENLKILIIHIPPRNLEKFYQYRGTTFIRKGTNVFIAKSDEIKKLYSRKNII
ncbi:MAG: ATP-binding protein [Candidatus Parvarchaeum sp.]